jgi:hypothetical protein
VAEVQEQAVTAEAQVDKVEVTEQAGYPRQFQVHQLHTQAEAAVVHVILRLMKMQVAQAAVELVADGIMMNRLAVVKLTLAVEAVVERVILVLEQTVVQES